MDPKIPSTYAKVSLLMSNCFITKVIAIPDDGRIQSETCRGLMFLKILL
jgi:hypothetical protein